MMVEIIRKRSLRYAYIFKLLYSVINNYLRTHSKITKQSTFPNTREDYRTNNSGFPDPPDNYRSLSFSEIIIWHLLPLEFIGTFKIFTFSSAFAWSHHLYAAYSRIENLEAITERSRQHCHMSTFLNLFDSSHVIQEPTPFCFNIFKITNTYPDYGNIFNNGYNFVCNFYSEYLLTWSE
jgi:hypothetical protein